MKNLSKLSANENKKSVPKIFGRYEENVCAQCGEENCDHDSAMVSKSFYAKIKMEERLADLFDNQIPEE